jgi:hypothetical protein
MDRFDRTVVAGKTAKQGRGFRRTARFSGMAGRFAAAIAMAWLSFGWTAPQGSVSHSLDAYQRLASGQEKLKLLPAQGNLAYLNPERNFVRQKIESLDDAIRVFQGNVAIDRYMRDSLGIAQAKFELYAGSAETADSLRDRVVGILQSLGLRFQPSGADRMDLGAAEGYWLNPGLIPVASAYFALRDSLMHLRTGSFRVLVRETPYHSPFSFDGDSALAFLKRLRDLTRGEDGIFRKRLLETVRLGGTDYEFNLGAECTIAVGRLLSAQERREKAQGQPAALPWFRLPSRDQPIVLRLDSIQVLAWSAIGLSAAGILMAASFWLAFAAGKKRKARARPAAIGSGPG